MTVAILDIDGTLVDTNYHHAVVWYRAFREHGLVLPIWRIHRHLGMGGDQLVAALTDERTEDERGDDIRSSEALLRPHRGSLDRTSLDRTSRRHRTRRLDAPRGRLPPGVRRRRAVVQN
jgi:beta-phosphoglucomutase-like phosphatase (HAD superfamily)